MPAAQVGRTAIACLRVARFLDRDSRVCGRVRWIVQAVVSTCQVLFMISRAPRVPWEAIYLPGTEAISYSLSFFGQGYILLANGKTLPWCRMAAWLCTVSLVCACAGVTVHAVPPTN